MFYEFLLSKTIVQQSRDYLWVFLDGIWQFTSNNEMLRTETKSRIKILEFLSFIRTWFFNDINIYDSLLWNTRRNLYLRNRCHNTVLQRHVLMVIPWHWFKLWSKNAWINGSPVWRTRFVCLHFGIKTMLSNLLVRDPVGL